jgi:hypothetical protein
MTFTDRIWSAALKSWGALITIVGVVASLLGFFIIPDTETVPLNAVLVFIFGIFIILGIFIRAAYDAHNNTQILLPKVKTVIDPPASYKDACALLLLEPTELLSHDSIISLFYIDGGIERLTGIGKVVNIQNDKKVQVIIFKDSEHDDKVKALKSNQPEDLENLIVKPSIPSFYLGTSS